MQSHQLSKSLSSPSPTSSLVPSTASLSPSVNMSCCHVLPEIHSHPHRYSFLPVLKANDATLQTFFTSISVCFYGLGLHTPNVKKKYICETSSKQTTPFGSCRNVCISEIVGCFPADVWSLESSMAFPGPSFVPLTRLLCFLETSCLNKHTLGCSNSPCVHYSP